MLLEINKADRQEKIFEELDNKDEILRLISKVVRMKYSDQLVDLYSGDSYFIDIKELGKSKLYKMASPVRLFITPKCERVGLSNFGMAVNTFKRILEDYIIPFCELMDDEIGEEENVLNLDTEAKEFDKDLYCEVVRASYSTSIWGDENIGILDKRVCLEYFDASLMIKDSAKFYFEDRHIYYNPQDLDKYGTEAKNYILKRVEEVVLISLMNDNAWAYTKESNKEFIEKLNIAEDFEVSV